MDNILMALGELTAERRHRKEEEKYVEVTLVGPYRPTNYVYQLRWLTGNRIQIVYGYSQPLVIGEIPLQGYGGFGPAIALAIQGVIEGHQLCVEGEEA